MGNTTLWLEATISNEQKWQHHSPPPPSPSLSFQRSSHLGAFPSLEKQINTFSSCQRWKRLLFTPARQVFNTCQVGKRENFWVSNLCETLQIWQTSSQTDFCFSEARPLTQICRLAPPTSNFSSWLRSYGDVLQGYSVYVLCIFILSIFDYDKR